LLGFYAHTHIADRWPKDSTIAYWKSFLCGHAMTHARSEKLT
jgi:hypothetical protein